MRRGILRLVALVGTVALLAAALWLTHSAGRGQCPKCGYLHDLHSCKYCGWTACGACWKQYGQYTCPNCGRGSP